MKYKKILTIIALSILLFSIIGVFVGGALNNCSENAVSKECTNIITGTKSLELFKERVLVNGNYQDWSYGLDNGMFRDYNGAIYRVNNGYFDIYTINNTYIRSFSFGLTGTVGTNNYIYTANDFNWTWTMDYNITSDEYVFTGYNNNIAFNWTQVFHFYPDKKVKIFNYLTNNLGVSITNTKFWYINTVKDDDFIEYNNNKYYLNTTLNLQGNYDSLLPQVKFNDNFVFEYSDLVNNGFNITNIFLGNGSIIGIPTTKLMVIGVTANNGLFPNGVTAVLDPSLDVTSGTTTLGGDLEYDTVTVHDGAILQVNGTKYLNITATNYIHIYGTVDGRNQYIGGIGGTTTSGAVNGNSGSGLRFGEKGYGANCPTSSATGGGGAGAGGVISGISTSWVGDGTYPCAVVSSIGGGSIGSLSNNNDTSVFSGSGGGGGGGVVTEPTHVATGGNGGGGAGWVSFTSTSVLINGSLLFNGNDGASGSGGLYSPAGGGGGGSGGTILINTSNLNIDNGIISVSGGNGGVGVGYTSAHKGVNGGSGSGGRIKMFYDTLSNISTTVGINNGGNIYYEKVSSSSFNQAPILNTNETIPTPDLNTNNIYFNITTSDEENDSIIGAFWTLTMPNSTVLINSVGGTWISGDSSLGQNETWESSRFNITNTTVELGQWNWSLIIQSNGTNPNNTFIDSFTIIDSETPSINLTSLSNNQNWYRNISIPIDFTKSDNVEINTCWYSLDEGTTNTTLLSCNNGTLSTNAGNYNFTLWVNDTSNNINTTSITNITLIEDIINPLITIVTPTGIVGKTFNIQVSESDLGGDVNCNYTIKTSVGGDTGVNNIQMPSCSTKSQDISINGNYETFVTINDTSGNINNTNQTFTVDTTIVVSSGGGGGGTTVIVGSSNASWSMTTREGGDNFLITASPGIKRTTSLQFKNLGSSSVKVKLECIDTVGKICQYVSFENNDISLPLAQNLITYDDIIINIPEDVIIGKYSLIIRGADELDQSGDIVMNLDIKNGFLNIVISKLLSNALYWLLLLGGSILFSIIFKKILFKKSKSGGFISGILGITSSIILIYLI